MTVPGKKLLTMLYLQGVTALVVAQFGLQYYEGTMHNSGDACHSAVSCFWTVMYKAIPAKSVGGIMKPATHYDMDGEPAYLLRFLFDMSFHIWVGQLLFSIVMGLMVNTFKSLDDAATARGNILANQTFVSGIPRSKFDDLGLPGAPPFDDLNKHTQNPWMYVFYLFTLQKKSPVEYTGVDSYIKDCMDRGDLKWLPRNTALVIQNASVEIEDEDAGDGGDNGDRGVRELLAIIGEGVANLKGGVADLTERLNDIEDSALNNK